MLVGGTLAISRALGHIKTGMLLLALTMDCIHPLVMFALRMLVGLKGVRFKGMIFPATLPIGANVYLYETRYKVAEGEVVASIKASSVEVLV
jgi:predicted permease